MRDKKAAIGLSVNVLVVVIISLVILGGGLVLLFKFIGGAEDIKSQLDQRTDQELERLLVSQGKMVALPLHTTEIYAGESHIFGIGFLNIGVEGQFILDVSLSRHVSVDGSISEISNEEITSWLLYDSGPFTVQEGEHRKEGIQANVPEDAKKGQYIFNAKIFVDGEQYGNTQKFTVNVK